MARTDLRGRLLVGLVLHGLFTVSRTWPNDEGPFVSLFLPIPGRHAIPESHRSEARLLARRHSIALRDTFQSEGDSGSWRFGARLASDQKAGGPLEDSSRNHNVSEQSTRGQPRANDLSQNVSKFSDCSILFRNPQNKFKRPSTIV